MTFKKPARFDPAERIAGWDWNFENELKSLRLPPKYMDNMNRSIPAFGLTERLIVKWIANELKFSNKETIVGKLK